MDCAFATVATPDGPFSLIASDEAVIASGWTDDCLELLNQLHPDLVSDCDLVDPAEVPFTQRATDAVESYYSGDFGLILDIPIKQLSSPFRMRAWQELRKVPAGLPITYGDLASMAGNPLASRAAGSACAHNTVALFVPCHRVVAAGPRLGGFGYRPALKASLLAREGWDGRTLFS